ncbi:replication initiator protein A [Amaricoccus tamworthensis]|uniref:replication initiator protein A n=1 Tax=Amaricoccus tamworthensis TaxID=57002 RepID=UPI003C7C94B9
MYELAHKHCGQKASWRISLTALQKKCGSASSSREFRRLVKAISDQDEMHGHIPDYAIRLESDMVIITTKGSISVLEYSMRLELQTYDQA